MKPTGRSAKMAGDVAAAGLIAASAGRSSRSDRSKIRASVIGSARQSATRGAGISARSPIAWPAKSSVRRARKLNRNTPTAVGALAMPTLQAEHLHEDEQQRGVEDEAGDADQEEADRLGQQRIAAAAAIDEEDAAGIGEDHADA